MIILFLVNGNIVKTQGEEQNFVHLNEGETENSIELPINDAAWSRKSL